MQAKSAAALAEAREALWLEEARALVEKCCPRAQRWDIDHAADRIAAQIAQVWMRYV